MLDFSESCLVLYFVSEIFFLKMHTCSLIKTNKITILVFQQLITCMYRAERRQREEAAHAYMILTPNTAG